jgi:hypothetical protein
MLPRCGPEGGTLSRIFRRSRGWGINLNSFACGSSICPTVKAASLREQSAPCTCSFANQTGGLNLQDADALPWPSLLVESLVVLAFLCREKTCYEPALECRMLANIGHSTRRDKSDSS